MKKNIHFDYENPFAVKEYQSAERLELILMWKLAREKENELLDNTVVNDVII